jgi:hypothetical protein
MVRLLLNTRGRDQQFERMREEIERLVGAGRVDRRLQILAERLRAGRSTRG